MIERAAELDAADPLTKFRERFALPEGVIYLDGNSLGPLPSQCAARIDLLTQDTNETGQHLYEKLGYERTLQDFYAYSLTLNR